MSVYRFSINSEKVGSPMRYYCMSRDIKAYIRAHRHQWSKMDKTDVKPSIHSIIGGHFGEWDYMEFTCVTECEYDENGKYIETNICGKDLLRHFIATDSNCINRNTLTFDKKQYNKDYANGSTKYTRPPPKKMGPFGDWLVEHQQRMLREHNNIS